MSESATTTPPPVETTPPAPDPATEEVVRIVGEAQKGHSLKDRLRGIKSATRTIVVFTDNEPVEKFALLDQQLTNIEALMNPEVPDDATEEQRAQLEESVRGLRDSYAEIEALREEARAEMNAVALAIHLRAVPAPVLKLAKMAADKAYALGDGTIPEDKRERWDEKRNRYILGRAIEHIGTPEGDLEFDRDTVAQDLEESLDLVQWARVSRAFSELIYTDQIGEAATADPGF